MLVLSPNLVSILLGWDGLGLVSYLLIVYYHNSSSSSAGMFTVVCNRVGDVFILLAISWMVNFGSWSFMYYVDFVLEDSCFFFVAVFVLVASMTSSAQIPFCAWLPAAMAAPTPVSALVHSSTLVTAGVYLLVRFSPVLYYYELNSFLLLVSLLTMLLSGVGANFEMDMSSIIALSTLSQLGFMIFILSIGNSEVCFFHLLVHALFSALLFMGAGVLIHGMGDVQDLRMFGCVGSFFPVVSSCVLVSMFSMCGVPFLSGFYSKDMIIEYSIMNGMGFSLFFAMLFCVGLTICYSFRFIYWIFCGVYCGNVLCNFNEGDMEMLVSMLLLSFFSVFGGSFMGWMFLKVPMFVCFPLWMSLLVFVVMGVGIWVGYIFMSFREDFSFFSFLGIREFLGSLFFMKYLTASGLIFVPLMFSGKVISVCDFGWFEMFGGQGMYLGLSKGFMFLRWLQENGVGVYFLFFFMWFVICFIVY